MAETPAKIRKQQEREKRREAGQMPVTEWVHIEDAPRLKSYAEKLRKQRAKSTSE